MATLFMKVETQEDGSQIVKTWQLGDAHGQVIEAAMGTPQAESYISLEQVVSSRDALGTIASIPGGLDSAAV